MKLIVMAGLVVALCTPAWAVTVPALSPGNNFLQMTDHSHGANYTATVAGRYTRDLNGTPDDPTDDTWDLNGTTYTYDGGASTGVTNVWVNGSDTFVQTVPPGQWQPNGNKTAEDTWGVFAWKELRQGKEIIDGVTGATIGMDALPGGATTYEWTSTAETGLLGMFYGGTDVDVEVGQNGSFAVHSDGVEYELWAVDTGLLGYDWDGTEGSTGDFTTDTDDEGPEWDPAQPHRRDSENTYENWVDIDDATKVGLIRAMGGYFRFSGEFVDAGGYFEGETTIYTNVDGPATTWAWNDLVGLTGPLFTDPDGGMGDLWFDMELVQDTRGWLAKSNDDGGFSAVPEPLTMLAVSGAVMGLGGYIRRRRD
jgi:hypothetical protein